MCAAELELGVKTKREVRAEDKELELSYQIAQLADKMIREEDRQEISPVILSSIYAFMERYFDELNDFCSVKVGYTEIGADKRLMQWMQYYPLLTKLFELPAYVKHNGEFYYFTDHLIHKLLRKHQYEQMFAGNPYFDGVKMPDTFRKKVISREFFVNRNNPHMAVTKELIEKLIDEIKQTVIDGNTKYHLPTSKDSRGSMEQNYLDMPVLTFAPYRYQKNAINELTDKLLLAQGTKNKCVLLDAPTRSGKTFIIFKTITELKRKLNKINRNNNSEKMFIVIVSGIVDIKPEFKELAQRHVDFKNSIKWLDKEEIAYGQISGDDAITKAFKDYDMVVTFISLQDLSGRADAINEDGTISSGDYKNIHKAIAGRVSLVVADECHMGMFGNAEKYKQSVHYDTKEMTKVEKKELDVLEEGTSKFFALEPKYGFIYSSATTYNIVDGTFFNDNNMVYISQDVIDNHARSSLAKAALSERGESSSEFFGKVNRFFFAIDLGELSVSELFKANNRGKFVNEDAAYAHLDAFWGIGLSDNVPPFMASSVIKASGLDRHMLWSFGTKNACDAYEAYIALRKKTHSDVFKDYHIFNISSANETGLSTRNASYIKNEIHKVRYDKSVTITVNRMMTGVSVPEWCTVVLCSAGNSVVRRVQAYGRPNTTNNITINHPSYNGEGERVEKHTLKPNSAVVDWDASAIYTIQKDLAKHNLHLGGKNNNNNDPNHTSLGTIFHYSNLGMKRMGLRDVHKQLESYAKRTSVERMTNRIIDNLSVTIDSMVNNESMVPLFDAMALPGKGKKINVALLDEQAEVINRSLKEGQLDTGKSDPLFEESELTGNEDDNNDDSDNSLNDNKMSPEEIEREKRIAKAKEYAKTAVTRSMWFAICVSEVNSLNDILNLLDAYDEYVASGNRGDLTDNVIENIKILSLNNYSAFLNMVKKNYSESSEINDSISSIRIKCLDDDGNKDIHNTMGVIQELAALSSNEIITPMNVANMLIDKLELDGDKVNSFITDNSTFIDPASKSGVNIVAFIDHCFSLGASVEELRDLIYAVPTSNFAYIFVRLVYDFYGLNADNIIFCEGLSALQANELFMLSMEFNACMHDDVSECVYHDGKNKRGSKLSASEKILAAVNDIIDKIDGSYNKDNIREFWVGLVNRDIKKFEYCVSNPPYQLDGGGGGSNALNIYPNFILYGKFLSYNSIMIHPARAFFGAGRINIKDVNAILNDRAFKCENFIEISDQVFPGTDITGGLIITNYSTGSINEPIIEKIIPVELLMIKNKVISAKNYTNFDNKILSYNDVKLSQEAYDNFKNEMDTMKHTHTFVSNVFTCVPSLFSDTPLDDGIEIIGLIKNKRIIKYFDARYLDDRKNYIGKWKVFLPGSNGSTHRGGIGNPVIGTPKMIATQTFIPFGLFNSKYEALNCERYIKSKFTRSLLSLLKVTPVNGKKTWAFIPNQDFTINSDINWDTTIDEIDKQLFKKYDLNKEEINWINTHIKPMK